MSNFKKITLLVFIIYFVILLCSVNFHSHLTNQIKWKDNCFVCHFIQMLKYIIIVNSILCVLFLPEVIKIFIPYIFIKQNFLILPSNRAPPILISI